MISDIMNSKQSCFIWVGRKGGGGEGQHVVFKNYNKHRLSHHVVFFHPLIHRNQNAVCGVLRSR